MVKKNKNGFGIASLVLGIISILFILIPLIGLICGILGIIFSVKQRKTFSNGVSTAGLVLSIIGTSMSFIFWAFMVLVLMAIPY